MPRKAKAALPPPLADGKKLQKYLDRVMSVQKKIDKLMQKAKEECGPFRSDIRAIKKEANENGLQAKVFNAHLIREKALHQIVQIPDQLDLDQRAQYVSDLEALGQLADTPLGKAATKAKPAPDLKVVEAEQQAAAS